jgi:lauroyl/myristoyl acyltransferase
MAAVAEVRHLAFRLIYGIQLFIVGIFPERLKLRAVDALAHLKIRKINDVCVGVPGDEPRYHWSA